MLDLEAGLEAALPESYRYPTPTGSMPGMLAGMLAGMSAGAQISCHTALNSIVAHVRHWLFAICHGG